MNPEADGHILQLAEIFRLMGDSTRLKIITACLNGPRAVAEIAAETGASPSLVRHHLRLLRAARIRIRANPDFGFVVVFATGRTEMVASLADLWHLLDRRKVGIPDPLVV